MSVVTGGSGSGDHLRRTTSLLDVDAAYTVCFWFYLLTDRNDYNHFWGATADSTVNQSGNWQNSDHCGTDSDGTTSRMGSAVGGSGSWDTGAGFSVNTWYHIAVVRSSTTSLEHFIDGVSQGSVTTDVGSRASSTAEFVGVLHDIYYAHARFAAMKQWSAALNSTEINNEAPYYDPVRTSNLHGWWPLQLYTDLDDESGLASAWTAVGTLSTAADPPSVGYQTGRTTKNTHPWSLGMHLGMGVGLPTS